MKKLLFILSLIIAVTSCKGNENKTEDSLVVKNTNAAEQQLKRYQVKSGIIHYTSNISGKVLGNTMSGTGTESVYFKDWGAIELRDEKSTETNEIKFFGKTKKETTNKHVVNKLDNGEWYIVDFDKKEITATRSLPIDAIKAFHPQSDAGETGKEMFKDLGGKKIGEENYMGYHCEIWEAMGVKQWVYKHITLKIESAVMGITTSKTATSIEFDIPVADSYFKLPDYPIVKQESFFDNEEMSLGADELDELDASMDKIGKLSYEEWKEMALSDKEDEEMQNMSEDELRETYNMIQRMVKMRQGN